MRGACSQRTDTAGMFIIDHFEVHDAAGNVVPGGQEAVRSSVQREGNWVWQRTILTSDGGRRTVRYVCGSTVSAS